MSDQPQGYRIGFKELYDELQNVKSALSEHLAHTVGELADLRSRVNALESAGAKRWQTHLAIVAAAVAILAAIVSPIVSVIISHK